MRFIRQEIELLREENQEQNTEIKILKDTIKLQNKTINQHEKTIKELGQKIKASLNGCKNNNYSSDKIKQRKRPARLLPLQLLFDKDEDDDDTTKKPTPRKFFGPPASCSDLSRLGYTLNGFYLVEKSNITKEATKNNLTLSYSKTTDTVYCAFKQDGAFNPSLVENKLALTPPLKQVIEVQEKVYTAEKKRDGDILELKQEMATLRSIVEDSRSSESSVSYIGNL